MQRQYQHTKQDSRLIHAVHTLGKDVWVSQLSHELKLILDLV
jgi:hypothetical protein